MAKNVSREGKPEEGGGGEWGGKREGGRVSEAMRIIDSSILDKSSVKSIG